MDRTNFTRHTMAAFGMVALMATVGCSDHPSVKTLSKDTNAGVRTGMVQNIAITDQVNPDAMTVRAGDEVRWLNQRQYPVTVRFREPLDGKVSCQGGFGKFLSSDVDTTTTLKAGESASLCFNRLGTVRYSVNTEGSDDTRPIKDATGTVTVK